MNPLYEQMHTSVFERMSMLAIQHRAVNLGQGFPDFGWPEPILRRASRSLVEEVEPISAVARPAATARSDRQPLPPPLPAGAHADQICVTSGATEALSACIMAAVSPGDEVIVFTPAYDSYVPTLRRAGATVREIALKPPSWPIKRDVLEAAVTPATRAIIFNNPHNPTGRLFSAEELKVIADGRD